MNFKKYLIESTSAIEVIKSFDVTKIDLQELLTAYRNAGYEVSRRDEKSFVDLYYKGWHKTSGHMYLVVCEDLDETDEDGNNFYVADFWVSLGREGKIEAEPGGNPLISEVSEEESEKFAENYRMK
jgi:hypothetical protein